MYRFGLDFDRGRADAACVTGGGDLLDATSATAHESDLADLEELAFRFGFDTGDGKPHELFRKPDSVRKAISGVGA
jgi:hypothetical protein